MPLLFASGRTPITEQGRLGSRNAPIHWGQEMFDQGGIVREFVKWDNELDARRLVRVLEPDGSPPRRGLTGSRTAHVDRR